MCYHGLPGAFCAICTRTTHAAPEPFTGRRIDERLGQSTGDYGRSINQFQREAPKYGHSRKVGFSAWGVASLTGGRLGDWGH